jgi:hypothetical protein
MECVYEKNCDIISRYDWFWKTTLLTELIKDGYETLPEEYIINQGYSFDNRLILSQWKWIGN